MQEKKFDQFYLSVFIGLNLILKFLYVSNAEIALDEPFSIRSASMPLNSILNFLSYYNNPPLFELLLHPIVVAFGPFLPWVRVLSVLFSALTVAFVYLIGVRFFSRTIGVFAALFFTFSSFNIYFSHEARVYALFNLLTTISVFLFLSSKDKTRFSLTLILLFVVNTLLVYAHYFGFVVWLLELSWLVMFRFKQPKVLLLFAVTFLSSFILYIPQLRILFIRYTDASQNHWVQAPSIEDLYINMMKMLNAPMVAVITISILFAALIKLIVKRKTVIISENAIFISHWFWSAYLGLFVVSLFVPVFLDRYLIFLSCALYLSLALSIDYLFQNKWHLPMHAVLTMLFIATTNLKPDNGRHWTRLIDTISAKKNNQTLVIIVPDWIAINYSYYYNIDYFIDYQNTFSLLQHDGYFPINRKSQLDSVRLDSINTIILVDGGSQYVDKEQSIIHTLETKFTQTTLDKSFIGTVVYTFKK